jgi:hypothetical protein
MQILIVVRHGDYDDDFHLSEIGKEKINVLTKKIKTFVNSKSVVVISSPKPRAKESADIIGQSIDILDPEINPILCIEGDSLINDELIDISKFVDSCQDRAEVIILVTHFGFFDFIPYYIKKTMNAEIDCDGLINKGEAWVIDHSTKKIIHIRKNFSQEYELTTS